jgi:hypothetical protein
MKSRSDIVRLTKTQKDIVKILLKLDDERLKNIKNPKYQNERLGAYVESDFTCMGVFYNVLIYRKIPINNQLDNFCKKLKGKGLIYYYPLWVIKVKDRQALEELINC